MSELSDSDKRVRLTDRISIELLSNGMPFKVKRSHRTTTIELETWKGLRQHLKPRLGVMLLLIGLVWGGLLLAFLMLALTRS